MDKLVAARVCRSVSGQFTATGQAVGIELTVLDGRVTLVGACSDAKMISDVVRLVHGIDGVRSVESRIEHISFVPSGG